jgi:preprotein translocase subunit SecG
MLHTFLLVLLIIDSVILVLAVLLQAGKGGGLAASFGGMTSSADSLLGTRQAGNLLTRASWWSGGVFLFLAFILSLMGARTRAPRSVLDQTFPAGAAAPAPVGQPATPGGGAVPLEPAAGGKAPAAPAPGTKTP